jgi:hypothetical protein
VIDTHGNAVAKLILVSIIFATVAIPITVARDPHPVRGLKKALFYAFLFNVAYLVGVLLIYPRVL